MPEVAPRPDELVLAKQYASAFFDTSLSATLAAARIDTLVICGVSTSGCVRATAVDAISHGYPPVVVRQAIGDRDPRPRDASLFDLQAKYAEVRDEAELIDPQTAADLTEAFRRVFGVISIPVSRVSEPSFTSERHVTLGSYAEYAAARTCFDSTEISSSDQKTLALAIDAVPDSARLDISRRYARIIEMWRCGGAAADH